MTASLLTLSMSVTASTLNVVHASSLIEARGRQESCCERKETEAVRKKIREAVAASIKMCETLDVVQINVLKNPEQITQEMLENNPFPSMVLALRELESQLRELQPPVGLEKDASDLVRAIARVRSRASIIVSSIRQMSTVPNTIESDIDMDGLKALAALGSKNSLKLVS
ncbi:hypothetical protein [Metapseudomonas otitidis]|uniref:hypothetical protein n=1 Tax=Metapseudomonas otitidis TaxID=319939 RepID=UPI0020973719|nr:hypothetical protein [Pseudomonas otitidis]MCO7555087.1 hypothetical protein [Pseudomonas otitidis]